MKKEEFLEKFIDAVQIEEDVNEHTDLSSLDEWDSLASVTVLALFNKYLGLKLTAQDIKSCMTVGDILNLGREKYAE